MKNQRLEFLKLVLKIIKTDVSNRIGICYCINLLYYQGIPLIKINEFNKWFQRQKPRANLNSSFTKHESFSNSGWWWIRNEIGKEQRILFLNYLIQKELTKV